MIKLLKIGMVCLIICGCTSTRMDAYQFLIENDFIRSEWYREKESAKVTVRRIAQNKTIEQLIEESGLVINPETFKDYEVVNFSVIYDGSYWLESYQVLRLCNKNTCTHKFLLMLGVHA